MDAAPVASYSVVPTPSRGGNEFVWDQVMDSVSSGALPVIEEPKEPGIDVETLYGASAKAPPPLPSACVFCHSARGTLVPFICPHNHHKLCYHVSCLPTMAITGASICKPLGNGYLCPCEYCVVCRQHSLLAPRVVKTLLTEGEAKLYIRRLILPQYKMSILSHLTCEDRALGMRRQRRNLSKKLRSKHACHWAAKEQRDIISNTDQPFVECSSCHMRAHVYCSYVDRWELDKATGLFTCGSCMLKPLNMTLPSLRLVVAMSVLANRMSLELDPGLLHPSHLTKNGLLRPCIGSQIGKMTGWINPRKHLTSYTRVRLLKFAKTSKKPVPAVDIQSMYARAVEDIERDITSAAESSFHAASK